MKKRTAGVRKRILGSARIFLATLNSCGSSSAIMSNDIARFDAVIVDEVKIHHIDEVARM